MLYDPELQLTMVQMKHEVHKGVSVQTDEFLMTKLIIAMTTIIIVMTTTIIIVMTTTIIIAMTTIIAMSTIIIIAACA